MKEAHEKRFIEVKAYEISYAIFRVAASVPNVALKDHLERQGLSLLDVSVSHNYAWVNSVSRTLEYLLRFGSDIGAVHRDNAERIIHELGLLNAAIADTQKPVMPEPVNLENVFSKEESPVHNSTVVPEPEPVQVLDETPSGLNGVMKAAIRQSAILDRIRQTGTCKLKDLQEILPDCSERTIRYDLQSLVEQGHIERIGSGGPAVFYRMRQPQNVG